MSAALNCSGVTLPFGVKVRTRGVEGTSVIALSSNSPATPFAFAHTQYAGLSVERITRKPSTSTLTFAFGSVTSL